MNRTRLKGVKTSLTDNSVVVTVDGKTVFEYVHPCPVRLIDLIVVGQMRPGPSVGLMEVQVRWGEDSWAWCDSDKQFTRIVHNSLVEENA